MKFDIVGISTLDKYLTYGFDGQRISGINNRLR